MSNKEPEEKTEPDAPATDDDSHHPDDGQAKEIGGRGGLDPTRYGDWEKNGRCIDF